MLEPTLTEIEAMREVMFTPVESFVTDRERADKGDEWAEKMAHKRMFAAAIKAVDKARGERTLWMVVLRFGRSSVFYSAFGPYPTEAQARKALDKLGSTLEYTAFAVVPMRTSEGISLLMERVEAGAESRGDFGVVAEDARAFKRGWNGKQSTRKKYVEAS